jgi:hypothetical protein
MDFPQISQWFDEFPDTRIPGALSNDENQFLEENIQAKRKEITTLQINIDENIDRIQMLKDHQKMTQDELEVIQVVFLINSI